MEDQLNNVSIDYAMWLIYISEKQNKTKNNQDAE